MRPDDYQDDESELPEGTHAIVDEPDQPIARRFKAKGASFAEQETPFLTMYGRRRKAGC